MCNSSTDRKEEEEGMGPKRRRRRNGTGAKIRIYTIAVVDCD